MGQEYGCNIFVGDYRATDDNGKPLSFDDFVKRCQGIHRLGVLRADVDNLGQAFISGFERNKDDKVNYEYVTLSRTSTLSKNLAMFFKYYINEILSNKQKYSYLSFSDEQTASNKRNLAIVYSGGDDVFIVGSYDEIIEVAFDLRETFKKYTQNTLTISAGISIYKSGYPISRMAEETGKLEDCSKNNPDKDSLTLFTDDGEGTFKWDDFKNNVIDEKLELIKRYFKTKQTYSPASGSSFLYNMLGFLKQQKAHRLAYLLSRVVKDNDKRSEFDNEFINNVYEWSKSNKHRRELIMAITLYIYLNRKEERNA
jgi:CRISPR-associated protein Csm1